MAFGEGQRLLWQQAASVLLLLLVSSPDYAQVGRLRAATAAYDDAATQIFTV
jgi:hypothetical protein